MDSLTPKPLYYRGNSPGILCRGGWLGPSSNLSSMELRKIRVCCPAWNHSSIPRISSLVTIPTELLLWAGNMHVKCQNKPRSLPHMASTFIYQPQDPITTLLQSVSGETRNLSRHKLISVILKHDLGNTCWEVCIVGCGVYARNKHLGS